MAGRGALGFNPRLMRYYLPQTTAETTFQLGIIRDVPRSSIPAGGCYDSSDFILDHPGYVSKRGAWAYQSGAMGANIYPGNMVAVPIFHGAVRIVATTNDNQLYDITGTTPVLAGGFIRTVDKPEMFHSSPQDKLIVANADGSSGPWKVFLTGGPGGTVTVGAVGGSPPGGKYVTGFANRIVLAGTAANPNRIYFGPAPDIDATWDQQSFIDTNHAITGLASIQGVLLVFSAEAVERVIGDVPPNNSGENMSLQPLGEVGCIDARTISRWDTNVVYASRDGVYVTNGGGFDSLTEKTNGTGIGRMYRDTYARISGDGFLAAGILGGKYYFLSFNSPTQPSETHVCYLPTKTWYRYTNMLASMYSTGDFYIDAGFRQNDEVFAIRFSYDKGNRVIALSNTVNPLAADATDPDGLPITPMLETRMIGDGIGLKAYEHGHVTYQMSGGTPTLNLSASNGIDASDAYSNVINGSLGPNFKVQRKRFILNRDDQGLSLRLSQSGPSTRTQIYALEVEARDATYGTTAEFVN